jgi:hypothetical protein
MRNRGLRDRPFHASDVFSLPPDHGVYSLIRVYASSFRCVAFLLEQSIAKDLALLKRYAPSNFSARRRTLSML